VDPFHPDRLGGFSPIAEISTLAMLNVGSISVLVTPLWYFVSFHLSVMFAVFTSLVIPIAFFISMHGVYSKLVNEKKVLLDNILDDFIYTTGRIESFIKSEEKNTSEIQEFNILTQTLSSLDIIYNKINSMRTFPLNYDILIKVGSSNLSIELRYPDKSRLECSPTPDNHDGSGLFWLLHFEIGVRIVPTLAPPQRQ
jgi:hypothetical protein